MHKASSTGDVRTREGADSDASTSNGPPIEARLGSPALWLAPHPPTRPLSQPDFLSAPTGVEGGEGVGTGSVVEGDVFLPRPASRASAHGRRSASASRGSLKEDLGGE